MDFNLTMLLLKLHPFGRVSRFSITVTSFHPFIHSAHSLSTPTKSGSKPGPRLQWWMRQTRSQVSWNLSSGAEIDKEPNKWKLPTTILAMKEGSINFKLRLGETHLDRMTRGMLSEYVTFYSWIGEDKNEQPQEELSQRDQHIQGPETEGFVLC